MLLKTLSELPGVSGDEGRVRAAIKEAADGLADNIYTDSMGNLIVHKASSCRKGNSSLKVMLAAHMDEVGLIVNGIEKSGHLRFLKVGGIDNQVLISKLVVIGPNHLPGVIGAKAVHLQKPKERKKMVETKQLYIDIGVKDRKEAEKLVGLGDYVAFATKVNELGDGCLSGKAFDNRAGCSVLLEILKKSYAIPLCLVFTVQEEIGLRGAAVAAYHLDPDLALVVETTSATDHPEIKDDLYPIKLGDGPALTLMDRSFIGDKKVLNHLTTVAKKNTIKYQFRRFTGGGTDAGIISLNREGVRTGVISIPCRYLHSPVSLLKLDDFYATVDLLDASLETLALRGGLHS